MLWEFLKSKIQNSYSQIVCENNAEMTYEEMIIFAEKYAEKLRSIKCCAIMCSSEMAAGLALLSCFAAKVTAVPLSQRYGSVHCNKILKTISPDAIITDQDGDFQLCIISDSQYIEPTIKPAIIMCTSGTTGNPKGAMLTEKNIITNVTDIADYFAIDKSDTILISRPLYHCAVLTGEFLTALVKGAKIRFYSGIFNPPHLLNMLTKYHITAFCGTPTLISLMARFKRDDDVTWLKYICISGECMSKNVGIRISKAFKEANIYHIYGLTEACPRVSYLPPNLFSKYADCVGIPLKSVSIKIINRYGKEAKSNEIGVLWVKGDNVMQGYYNDPKKTKKVLKNGWLCTGDLALINDAGLLKIKGRNDDLIIKSGMNIYPQEIEGTLKADSRVKDVLVKSQKDEKIGVKLILDISGDFKNTSEVKKLCSECLSPYQMPSEINLLKELPKNASGKIIRR